MVERKILLGNEAIAHGLLEAGCSMATSYPGTPASEIMATLIQLKKHHGVPCHLEWSVNEKVAVETALANSYAGRRSAAAMKQVGLNVAADPVMSAAYTGVKGGFLLIVADDPGPHSSQTEQDTRQFAMFAKLPVLDPALPSQAREWIASAYTLSEHYEIPVILRPTTRVCHARQDMAVRAFCTDVVQPVFEKDPGRWAATPKFRYRLHQQLNEKLEKISRDALWQPRLLNADALREATEPQAIKPFDKVLVTSGAVCAHAVEILRALNLWDRVPIYQVPMPYPLSEDFCSELLEAASEILVLEETQPVIEGQIRDRKKVRGRWSGHVPKEGELLPEIVENILRRFLNLSPAAPSPPPAPGRRPTLCAGCGHRAAFFAIRKVFPKGIYASDIGCYTLGLNLGAVDTVLCMGASISQAAGFYHAYRDAGQESRHVVATIGDSTFYHAGVPALINAVTQGCRFPVIILDNGTTAMTGHQPTPAAGVTADGTKVPAVSLEALAKACGVNHVSVGDPYDVTGFMELLQAAKAHCQDSENGGMAVVIARRPCLMEHSRHEGRKPRPQQPIVTEKCEGCGFCLKFFECPALIFHGENQAVTIDDNLCAGCGVCVEVCPHKAIVKPSADA
ncbi:thiamine pyrophosphate-dependent enzyme [Desulfosoma caldarium]|uniref:Indolepyruvate oxidoreductase subunit IorA n=1 Tax=Desulfosoma caldarium TaxID=610254 RepID=A0A3N1VM00_9BACT|nr:thiamine pyrophosphate-dependent enzyme [Desulfosoma caldarium]ROR03079.1 indolepyruvate ferredoxin oxidoreductase alpha subunit [Desulfosoma caldarium]